MSDSVRLHRQQPTRLHHLWDSPGKNTGAGCHFHLQCTKVKSESEATQLCPTLCDSMDCSVPGSSVHGIFQARVLELGAIGFSNTHVYGTLKCFLDFYSYPMYHLVICFLLLNNVLEPSFMPFAHTSFFLAASQHFQQEIWNGFNTHHPLDGYLGCFQFLTLALLLP